MRLPTDKEGLRSSKLIKIVAGGSALVVSSVAVAQALDGGPSPDVDAVDLRGGNRVDDARQVVLDIEGNTVTVPAETLLGDDADDSNGSPDDSPNDSPAGATAGSNDSPDDSPATAPTAAAEDSPDDSPATAPAPAANDSPDDTDSGDDSADDT